MQQTTNTNDTRILKKKKLTNLPCKFIKYWWTQFAQKQTENVHGKNQSNMHAADSMREQKACELLLHSKLCVQHSQHTLHCRTNGNVGTLFWSYTTGSRKQRYALLFCYDKQCKGRQEKHAGDRLESARIRILNTNPSTNPTNNNGSQQLFKQLHHEAIKHLLKKVTIKIT